MSDKKSVFPLFLPVSSMLQFVKNDLHDKQEMTEISFNKHIHDIME